MPKGCNRLVVWNQSEMSFQWSHVLVKNLVIWISNGSGNKTGSFLLFLVFSTYMLPYFSEQFRGSWCWCKERKERKEGGREEGKREEGGSQYSGVLLAVLIGKLKLPRFFTNIHFEIFLLLWPLKVLAGRSFLTYPAPYSFPFSPSLSHFSVLQPNFHLFLRSYHLLWI